MVTVDEDWAHNYKMWTKEWMSVDKRTKRSTTWDKKGQKNHPVSGGEPALRCWATRNRRIYRQPFIHDCQGSEVLKLTRVRHPRILDCQKARGRGFHTWCRNTLSFRSLFVPESFCTLIRGHCVRLTLRICRKWPVFVVTISQCSCCGLIAARRGWDGRRTAQHKYDTTQ